MWYNDACYFRRFIMRYTADEERNRRCLLGKNYEKNEEKKLITYNPSENHKGERDLTTMDSIKNMLYIMAQEDGYAVETTINGAHFVINLGMDFDDAWRAFKDALNNLSSVEKDSSWEKKEQERLATVKSIDTAEVLSRLSGIYVPGVNFDNSDIKYVLKNMKNYKYDESKDVNQNIVEGFAQYPLSEVAALLKQSVQMYKAKGMDLGKIITKDYILKLAALSGIPEKLLADNNYIMDLTRQIASERE